MEAVVTGRSLPISTKQSIEICSYLRGKTTERGKTVLQHVIEKKAAIPYKRFNDHVGHKRGMAAGRYPINASMEILSLIKSAESNAENKGMVAPFKISEMIANQASRPWHYGRQRRVKMKRTHVKIVISEIKKQENKK